MPIRAAAKHRTVRVEGDFTTPHRIEAKPMGVRRLKWGEVVKRI
jgi:hypothetical protein